MRVVLYLSGSICECASQVCPELSSPALTILNTCRHILLQVHLCGVLDHSMVIRRPPRPPRQPDEPRKVLPFSGREEVVARTVGVEYDW